MVFLWMDQSKPFVLYEIEKRSLPGARLRAVVSTEMYGRQPEF